MKPVFLSPMFVFACDAFARKNTRARKMKLMIALLTLSSLNAFAASSVHTYQDDAGDKISITFKDGTPVSASYLDWGKDGNNIMNKGVSTLKYRDNIQAIRVEYSGGMYSNFYLNPSNMDCLGYSGLAMVGPTDMCEFKKMR